MSEEWKNKIRKADIGKKRSEETKQKLSKSHKGNVSARKGVKLSEEQKKKISESSRKYFALKKQNMEMKMV